MYEALPQALHEALLGWYATQKRDLPWRHTRVAYAVLVSEFMLQQTGVERVIPKYRAFLVAFPTLEALAAAPTADVIRLWSGLGYNRRAVWLQRAAQAALAHWGRLPDSVVDLLSLPGVGPYTARAVACFAYGAQEPVVDTNVRRVLTRLLRGPEMIVPPLGERELLRLAAGLLPPGRAYDWNQALMDLGASVCTHDNPACLICPVREGCSAFPAIQTALAARPQAVAEGKPVWKEEPFAGSRRYYRGRIIEALRGLPAGGSLALGALGRQVKADYAEHDAEWLLGLLRGLQADGLLVVREADGTLRVSLPG